MTEERKVQFIFQNMEPILMQKVFPQMNRMDTAELFRRFQAHSQASLIAGRSLPLNAFLPTPPTTSKDDIEKLVREEVTKSLEPIVQKLEEATRSLGANRDRERVGGDRISRRGIKITQIKGRWTYGPYVMHVGNPAISLDIAQRMKLPRNNRGVENDRAEMFPLSS